MFDRVQVRVLAGPLNDIQRLLLKPLLRCLGCVLRVIVLLEVRGPERSGAGFHQGSLCILVPMVWKFLGAFWQTPNGLSCAFYWIVASIWPLYHKRPDWWSAAEMVVLLEGSPISTEELCSSLSDHRVLGHLPDQGLSSHFAQFGQAASSKKILGGSKLLSFKNDGGHCVIGDLQWCRNVLVSCSRSVPWHNPVSELYGQFLRPHGLVFALTCTVNFGTLYIFRCVSFQIMSNQLNLPQVDSN